MSNVVAFRSEERWSERDIIEARVNIDELERRKRVISGCLDWWKRELDRIERLKGLGR